MTRPVGVKEKKTVITATGCCQACGEDYERELSKRSAHLVKWCSKACGDRDNRLRREYGISFLTFKEMLVAQENKCAICRIDFDSLTPFEINIDHCHIKGHVRKILCSKCNTGIGLLKDSPELLRLAAIYLEENAGV